MDQTWMVSYFKYQNKKHYVEQQIGLMSHFEQLNNTITERLCPYCPGLKEC